MEWILTVEHPETTYERLESSGPLATLDGKLPRAPWECVPDDKHPLRQELNKLRTVERVERSRMMSGRQILWVIYSNFRINPQDRAVTDLAI